MFLIWILMIDDEVLSIKTLQKLKRRLMKSSYCFLGYMLTETSVRVGFLFRHFPGMLAKMINERTPFRSSDIQPDAPLT